MNYDPIARLQRVAADVRGRSVLVLGSAPGAVAPADIGDRLVVTINGSQEILRSWTGESPYLTLFNTVYFRSRASTSFARKMLRGTRTRNLIVMQNRRCHLCAVARLLVARYGYDHLVCMEPVERTRVVADALSSEAFADLKPSNGVFAALLMLHLGAADVTLAGFSFSRSGHAYNSMNLPRNHVDDDRRVLVRVSELGLPVTCTSPDFSVESGLACV